MCLLLSALHLMSVRLLPWSKGFSLWVSVIRSHQLWYTLHAVLNWYNWCLFELLSSVICRSKVFKPFVIDSFKFCVLMLLFFEFSPLRTELQQSHNHSTSMATKARSVRQQKRKTTHVKGTFPWHNNATNSKLQHLQDSVPRTTRTVILAHLCLMLTKVLLR